MNSGSISYEPTIFLVPHTHYDAIWVFNKEDYYYINIELILKQAIDLIKKTDYKFTIEQTFLLEEVEANYPQLFSEIKKYAKEKRIEIAGGQYLLSDVMLPNGEVLIREILEGKKYVKQKLDQEVIVGWGADEFGFNAQWPQILRGCGYKYFAFRRGVDKAKPSEFLWAGLDGSSILCHWMPLGYRAGLDLARLEESYHKLKKYAATDLIIMPSGSGVTLPQPETSLAVKEWNLKNGGNIARMVLATPSEFFNSLERKLNNTTTATTTIAPRHHELEVRRGEMYSGKLSEVFPDCTSSRMWIKQGAKDYENILLALERWNTICFLEGCINSSDLLRSYWKKILFIAMHDALPGTGIDEVYDEIKEIFNTMQQGIRKSLDNCLLELSRKIKIENKGNASGQFVAVFNSLPWQVKDWTELALEFDKGDIKWINGLSPIGEGGKEHKDKQNDNFQDSEKDNNNNNDVNRTNNDNNGSSKLIDVEVIDSSFYPDNSIKQIRIGFITSVPAFGFRTFELIPAHNKPVESILASHDTQFKNSEFEIQVNPENATISVSKNGKHYITNGNELLLEEELGDLYYHRENLGLLKSEGGAGVKYGSFKPEKFVSIKGKLRSRIVLDSTYYALRWPYRLTDKLKPLLYRHNFLEIQKEIVIYNDLPRVDFITRIHDRHPHSRIRVKFDISPSISSQSYCSGTQFGAIERKVNQFYYKEDKENIKWNEKPTGIFPSLEWLDYSDKDGKAGVSLLNVGLPSNEIRDNSIYLTLLRSVVVLSSDGIMGPCIPTPDAAETRPYTFRYSVLPHDNSWSEAATYRHGMQINMPLIAVHRNDRKKKNYSTNFEQNEQSNKQAKKDEENRLSCLPVTHSFLQIDPKNVVLSTLKISEDERAIIIRLYEIEGRKTVAELKFDRKFQSVQATDLLENEIEQEVINNNNNNINSINNSNNDSLLSSKEDQIRVKVEPFKIVTLKVKF